METIEEQILSIVKNITQNETIEIKQSLLDEGLLDSLTTIELITKLEEQFKISIDNDELNHENFNTISNISSIIKNKIK